MTINPIEWHQVNIAKQTLRMADALAAVLGGMTKPQARDVLRTAGWSTAKIARFERG